MKNTIQILAVLLLTATVVFGQQSPTQQAYIEKYKEIAIREMERVGVPASIKLAQGLLESNSGQSVLARRANNHFGMKCGSTWNGETIYREDDDYNDQGQLIKSCFRGYKNGEASYVAHSEFLRDPRKEFRYGFLFRLDPTDYQRWAYGLKQAGYATSPTYPEKLLSLIERYQLYQYDNYTIADNGRPTTNPGGGVTTGPPINTGGTPVGGNSGTPTTGDRLTILTNNDVRYTVVGSGESLDDVARRVESSVRNLINYNEKVNNVNQRLEAGTQVYIQPKRNGYRGKQKYHDVKAGETMFDISQQYGVKLKKLLKRNRLEEGQQPASRERIKLRGWKVKERPALSTERPASTVPNTAPELPSGEIDFEEPDMEEDVTPPAPAPNRPPVIVQPEGQNGSPSADPVIIINSGSNPSPNTPNTPNPTPIPVPNQPQVEQPTSSPPPVIITTPAPTSPTNTAQYHTIVSGDTLYNISRRYNLTVDELKALNNLTSNNISLGAKLRVK